MLAGNGAATYVCTLTVLRNKVLTGKLGSQIAAAAVAIVDAALVSGITSFIITLQFPSYLGPEEGITAQINSRAIVALSRC